MIAAATLLLALALWPLVHEPTFDRLFDRGGLGSTKRVARLGRSNNDVRRRAAEELSWTPARQGDPILDGDSVFTGSGSDAEVAFLIGDVEVALGSDSLVVVLAEDGKALLDLKQGGVSGKMGSGAGAGGAALKLRSGGKETEIAGQGAKIGYSVGARGEAQVAVFSGQVQVKSEGKTAVVKENQSVAIDAGGALAEVRTYSVEALLPAQGARVRTTPGAPSATFGWKRPADLKGPVWIEIAEDEAMSRVVARKKTAAETVAIPGLRPGPLHWRVSTEEKGKTVPASLVRSFVLVENRAPELSFPREGQKLEFAAGSGSRAPASASGGIDPGRDEGVDLQWKDSTGAVSHRLELSLTPDFKAPLWSGKSDSDLASTPGLLPGRYYWRVRGVGEDGIETPWSRAASFEVRNVEVPGVASPPIELLPGPEQLAPETSAPAGGARPLRAPKLRRKHIHKELSRGRAVGSGALTALRRLYDALIPDAGAAPRPEAPELQWEAVENAASYRVEISPNEDFSGGVVTLEVAATRTVWDDFRLGKHFWRVTAIDAEGKPGEPSEVGTVSLSPAAPRGGEDVFRQDPPRLELHWKKNRYARAYEAQVADTPAFKEPIRVETRDTSAEIRVPARKTYYWRVRSMSEESRGRYSASKRVEPPARVIARVSKPKPLPKREPAALPQRSTEQARFELFKFSRPERTLVGVALGFSSLRIEQPSVSGAGRTFPRSAGDAYGFNTAQLEAESWFGRHWGVGGELLLMRYAVPVSAGAETATLWEGTLEGRAQVRFSDTVSLVLGLGAKRRAGFFVEATGPVTAAVTQVGELAASQSAQLEWAVLDRTLLLRGRVETSEAFREFPRRIFVSPSFEARKGIGRYWVGLRYTLSPKTFALPGTGGAEATFDQQIGFVTIGAGF